MHALKVYGEMELQVQSFLTAVPDGGQESLACHSHCMSSERSLVPTDKEAMWAHDLAWILGKEINCLHHWQSNCDALDVFSRSFITFHFYTRYIFVNKATKQTQFHSGPRKDNVWQSKKYSTKSKLQIFKALFFPLTWIFCPSRWERFLPVTCALYFQ